MTDEELEKIKKISLPKCPSCGSKNTSVRVAKYNEFLVGCLDCENKRLCDKNCLVDTIESWTNYARKVWARRGKNE